MIQHLLKWAAVAALWRQGKPYFAGTVFAAAGLLITNTLHAEFVDYIRLTYDLGGAPQAGESSFQPWILGSFVMKWAVFAVIVATWVVYCRRVSALRSRGTKRNSSVNEARSNDAARQTKTPEIDPTVQAEEDQAFDFLRKKRKLRGRGDLILKDRDAKD